MLGKCFRRLVCLNQIIYLLLRWWKIVQFWKALCLVFNCVCTVSKSMKLLTYSYIPMCSKQSFTQFYKLYMYITYVWSPSFSVWVSVSLSHSESVNVHVYVQATCTHLYLSHSLNTHTLSHTHTRARACARLFINDCAKLRSWVCFPAVQYVLSQRLFAWKPS